MARFIPGRQSFTEFWSVQWLAPYGGGEFPFPLEGFPQTIAVGLASETDEAQQVRVALIKAVGQATETDAGLALSLAFGFGIANETDSARPVAVTVILPIGLASETDEARLLSLAAGFS